MRLKALILIGVFALFSASCSVVAKNRIDLTLLDARTGEPKRGCDILLSLPKSYGNPYIPEEKSDYEFIRINLKTDENGRAARDVSVWYAQGGFWQRRKGVEKPVFFVDTADIGEKCSLVLQYSEDENVFRPLKLENGGMKPLVYPEDVTGSFERRDDENGWTVRAVIRRADRICP